MMHDNDVVCTFDHFRLLRDGSFQHQGGMFHRSWETFDPLDPELSPKVAGEFFIALMGVNISLDAAIAKMKKISNTTRIPQDA